MKTNSEAKLDQMVREVGLGTLLRLSGGENEEKIRRWSTKLESAYQMYTARYGAAASLVPALSEENLARELKSNAHRAKAFLQALAWEPKPEMLVMAWRILQGDKIQAVQMNYEHANVFSFTVTLRDPASRQQSIYTSDDIDDAALLRHFGIAKKGGRPLFDGFYSMRHPS